MLESGGRPSPGHLYSTRRAQGQEARGRLAKTSLVPCGAGRISANETLALQFFPNFLRRFAGRFHRVRGEADRAHLSVAATAVAFADGCQVVAQRLANPGIRAHGDLRTV